MSNGPTPVNSGAMNAIGKEQFLKAALGTTNSELRQPKVVLAAFARSHDISDLQQLPRKQTHFGNSNLVGLK